MSLYSHAQGIPRDAISVIPGRLVYAAMESPPLHLNTKELHFFSTDKSLVFYSFFSTDFGPLSLGHLYRFCQSLKIKLLDAEKSNRTVVYFSGTHPHRRANSIYLITAFSLLYLGKSPEEAYAPFSHIQLIPFHDASPLPCTYHLGVLDCLNGLARSRSLGFLDFDSFDIEEYEHFEKVENGDLNWIFPGKFVAFAGPHETRSNDPMYPQCVPEDYIAHFKQKNVTLIVRLNKKYYDERRFTRVGFEHVEIYYLDGSNPPPHLLQKFLDYSEKTSGAVAVHCKAGLGRTGTCIGCYAMKHYGYTAAEAIGWMRISRPGSVIGPQQQFMEDMQYPMWQAGEAHRSLNRRLIGSGSIGARDEEKGGDATPPGAGIRSTFASLTATPIQRERKDPYAKSAYSDDPFFSTEEREGSQSQGDILLLRKSPINTSRRTLGASSAVTSLSLNDATDVSVASSSSSTSQPNANVVLVGSPAKPISSRNSVSRSIRATVVRKLYGK